MLVIDSARAQEIRAQKSREAETEKKIRWAQMEVENAQYLEGETDPTYAPRRIGRPLLTKDFEIKLKKILPQAQFLYGPLSFLKQKKVLLIPRNGTEPFSLIYEDGLMPERSIMSRSYAETIDPSVFSVGDPSEGIPPGLKTLSRADLPKHEFVPGYGYKFDQSKPMPGMKRTAVPWREEIRGWRTILLRLIVAGLVEINQVEKEFYGPDSSPEWAGRTGRREVTRPW